MYMHIWYYIHILPSYSPPRTLSACMLVCGRVLLDSGSRVFGPKLLTSGRKGRIKTDMESVVFLGVYMQAILPKSPEP